jgi:rubrerythrin
MINREELLELAKFESPEGAAVSFYYQPGTPHDKSHREETIQVKDLIRGALHAAEKNGNHKGVREDLERILALAESLKTRKSGKRRTKVVFSCGQQGFWREYELPVRFEGGSLTVGRQFHLHPLSVIGDEIPKVCVGVVGRTTARLFELSLGEIKETDKFVSQLPRRTKSDGFLGYDAGHAERHIDNEALHHFKKFADRLQRKQEKDGFERLIIGCRDETWADIEPRLHPYARQRLIGRFTFDPSTETVEQVQQRAEQILKDFREKRNQELLKRVVDEAKGNALGALGIKRVLRSIQTGEAQTLLLGDTFAACAAECRNCGHVEPLKTGIACPVCGSETRAVDDVSDLLLAMAVRKGIEIVHVPPSPEFEKIGNIAALLRFRADHNTNVALQTPAG